MLVGLSPTEDELTANTFALGPAGELMQKLFESLGIARNECYTTWFAKKPLLSPPLPRQQGMLRRMLAREVKLIRPEIVVLLGENVFRATMNSTASIQEEGGKAFTFADTRTTTILEPQAMLANPSLKVITWKTHLPRSGFFRMQGS